MKSPNFRYYLLAIPGIAFMMMGYARAATDLAQPKNAENTVDTVVVTGVRKPDETEQTDETRKLNLVPAMMGDPLQAVFALRVLCKQTRWSASPPCVGRDPMTIHF